MTLCRKGILPRYARTFARRDSRHPVATGTSVHPQVGKTSMQAVQGAEQDGESLRLIFAPVVDGHGSGLR